MKAFEKQFEKSLVPEKFRVVAEGFWRKALMWGLNPEEEIGHCSFMKCSFADRVQEELESGK